MFNKNKELKELEIIKVPGLQVEEENRNSPQQTQQIQKPQEISPIISEPRQL